MLELGWQAVISAGIAGSVGSTELLGRYRSNPAFSIRQPAAVAYVTINAAAGALAAYLVHAFGWSFGQTQNVALWRILVSGFGALALFRSSLFVTKIGGTDVKIGPSALLDALLAACDRTIDRVSAKNLAELITDEKLADFNPAAVGTALPVLCLALMQNFDASDQALLAADLNKLRQDSSLSPEVQMRAVIVALAKYLGEGVVTKVLEERSLFAAPAGGGGLTPAVVPEPTASDKAAVIELTRRLTHPDDDDTAPVAPPAPVAVGGPETAAPADTEEK